MFDEKKYRESFSAVHASDTLLSEIEKATSKKAANKKTKRKRYIPRTVQTALVCLALILIPGITVFAYGKIKSVLLYFKGDTGLIEEEVRTLEETAQGEQYRVHVDSMLADSQSTVLGLSIEALSDEAEKKLFSQAFDIRYVVRFDYEGSDAAFISMSWKSSKEAENESIRSFAVRLDGLGAPNTVKLYVKDGKASPIVLNIDTTVEKLSACALPDYKNGDYFISSCELSATQISYVVSFDEPVKGDKIVEIYFRNADGSLCTLQQLAGNETDISFWTVGEPEENTYRYTQPFSTLINPLSVSGVIMNGVEYSFPDNEYVAEVDIPKNLKPFLSPFVEKNNTFYAYAGDICDNLDALIENAEGKYSIRYRDNTLEFSVGSPNVYLNGEEKIWNASAVMEGDEVLIPGDFIDLLGVRRQMYYPQKGEVQPPEYWLITP